MPPAGRYNAGQKLLFWVLSGAISPAGFRGRVVVVVYGIACLEDLVGCDNIRCRDAGGKRPMLLIGNFMIHIYMGGFCETRRV